MESRLGKLEAYWQRIVNFVANTKKMGRAKLTSNVQVAIRRKLLDDYWAAFELEHFRVLEIVQSESDVSKVKYFADDIYTIIEMAYQEAASELEELREQNTPCASTGVSFNSSMIEQRVADPQIRMVPITPPTFSGDVTQWTSFRDLFQSVVIANRSLNPVQKLQYLKMSCKGDAEELLRDIAVTEGNFNVAWDELKKRYENKRLTVSKLVEKLLAAPSMNSESAFELKSLLDRTNQALRSLKAMKREVEHWDDIVVVQTVNKLDINTRKSWERFVADLDDMPTYEQLDSFLVKELRSMEAMQDVSPQNQSLKKSKMIRSHVVATKPGCFICKGSHALYACEQFLAMSVAERRKLISKMHICYNCISTDKHISRECTSKYLCRECHRKHNTLLHETDEASSDNALSMSPSGNKNVQSHFANDSIQQMVLLATAWVNVQSNNGQLLKIRALIDPGSHASFITEKIAVKLGGIENNLGVNIFGIGDTSAGKCIGEIKIMVSSCTSSSPAGIAVNALVMKRITNELPSLQIPRREWPHLHGLTLADANYTQPGTIDMLLGADAYAELVLTGVRRCSDGPLAQETMFGWILTGHVQKKYNNSLPCRSVHAMHVNLDDQLRKFWELEEVESGPTVSIEDAECEKKFIETVERCVDGRYSLQLPFRSSTKALGESRAMAVRRLLQMEKRFASNIELYAQYQQFMDTYLELDHMEMINNMNEITEKNVVYLPHHAILKPSSTTTKLRVVFDASQATSSGRSLNDMLLTGPRLQDDLATILIRWRRHKVALSADVEKMYRQIWITPQHRDFQRIVWRRTPEEPIADYRLKTITYGTSSAPYMAVRAMQQLADDEQSQFPLAATVVKRDFYMDDCLTGADNIEDALKLKNELIKLMQSGGMRLLKWSSNSKEVLESLPVEYRECSSTLDIEADDTIKTLGVHWHPAADQFGFKVTLGPLEEPTTKRKVLSDIAKLFDPLALLAPAIVTAKIFMQQLWLTGLSWDAQLPVDMCKQWREYRQELFSLESIRINRWTGMENDEIQIHGFSDASKLAYSACVYVRVLDEDGDCRVTLLAAKTRVAPIKQISIPRLELNGAVLLCKLLHVVQTSMRMEGIRTVAWTDSTVVLAWIRGHANRWPTFIANRVSVIQTGMNGTQWRHVPGCDNPADVASRGIKPSMLGEHPLWWSGPEWLKRDEEDWPNTDELLIDESLLEEKKGRVSALVVNSNSSWELVNRYSSLIKLLRVTAYCFRVFRRNDAPTVELRADEIKYAVRFWILRTQEEAFSDEIDWLKENKMIQKKSKIINLNPFLDEDGILRVGGRIQQAVCSFDERHPIILPKQGAFSKLIIANAHEKVLHYGPQQTIAQIRQQYWILGVRNVVKALIRACVLCFRTRPITKHQIMGNLPANRVVPARPFLHSAVDYAGPIATRLSKGRGQKSHKSWIAVFVCLVSKAIHLELVSDLTTEGFLAAYKRFTARRGRCSDIYCDNATNFVGAAGEMGRHLNSCVKDEQWGRQLADDGSRFHFAPAGSPHFNGLAEAAVKITKSALKKIVGDHKLTFEEMVTFLAQTEAIVNSRPLCPLTNDVNDAAALTPGHFLIGQPLTAVPERSRLSSKENSVDRWKLVQRLSQQFWKRWSTEYLHSMQQRSKWHITQRNVQVGDVVIIRDELAPPTKWKMGRIDMVHPGDDGIIRVVTIRTGKSLIKRSIVKICVLPLATEEQNNVIAKPSTTNE